MQTEKERQPVVTRLALCVVLALVIGYGGEKVCTALKLPIWETCRPWLEKNRVQAVAVVAALLFGASLALFPLPPEAERGEDIPEGYEPCGEEDH